MNAIQEKSEATRLGIPALYKSNARNHIDPQARAGINESAGAFSPFPKEAGIAAAALGEQALNDGEATDGDMSVVEDFAEVMGDAFGYHLKPFEAAIEAGVSSIMPYYGVPLDVTYEGVDYEEVGMAFSDQIVNGLLRDQMGFDGYVNSDTGIINDRAWGLEDATVPERVAAAINGGTDTLSGFNDRRRCRAHLDDGAQCEHRQLRQQRPGQRAESRAHQPQRDRRLRRTRRAEPVRCRRRLRRDGCRGVHRQRSALRRIAAVGVERDRLLRHVRG